MTKVSRSKKAPRTTRRHKPRDGKAVALVFTTWDGSGRATIMQSYPNGRVMQNPCCYCQGRIRYESHVYEAARHLGGSPKTTYLGPPLDEECSTACWQLAMEESEAVFAEMDRHTEGPRGLPATDRLHGMELPRYGRIALPHISYRKPTR